MTDVKTFTIRTRQVNVRLQFPLYFINLPLLAITTILPFAFFSSSAKINPHRLITPNRTNYTNISPATKPYHFTPDLKNTV